jgi:hypothetical protein
MQYKSIFTISFSVFTSIVFSQKVSVSEVNESRSTSDNSYNKKCEIVLKISGDEARKYKFVKIAKVTKAVDDQDLDLLNEEKTNSDYKEIDQEAKIEIEIKNPARKANTIKELSGELSLYNPSVTNGGIVKISGYQSKANTNLLPNNSPVQIIFLTKEFVAKYVKENKDKKEEELKKMPEIARKMAEGLISAFEGMFDRDNDSPNQAFFYINGDESKFVTLYFEDANGKKVERNGSSTNNGLMAYTYDEKPNPNWKLILNIETANSIKKLPFKILNIDLP